MSDKRELADALDADDLQTIAAELHEWWNGKCKCGSTRKLCATCEQAPPKHLRVYRAAALIAADEQAKRVRGVVEEVNAALTRLAALENGAVHRSWDTDKVWDLQRRFKDALSPRPEPAEACCSDPSTCAALGECRHASD